MGREKIRPYPFQLYKNIKLVIIAKIFLFLAFFTQLCWHYDSFEVAEILA